MIKKIASYIAIFGSLSLLAILLFDVVVMPGYVRMNEGRYMVNVTGKTLQHAIKVLESEGYNGLVSDTLYSATYEAGTIVDQYPLPNTGHHSPSCKHIVYLFLVYFLTHRYEPVQDQVHGYNL